MTVKSLTRFPKTAVMAMAAVVYVPLVVDRCVPGAGLHEAAKALGSTPEAAHPAFWAFLVQHVGRDITALSTISLVSALICVALLAVLADDIVSLAVRLAQKRVTRTDTSFSGVRMAAVGLTAATFILTPGFLRAATHISPLMSLILPPLLVVTIVIRMLAMRQDDERVFDHVKRHWVLLMMALALAAYSCFELFVSRRLLLEERWSFFVFFLIGVFPLLTFADLTRRWLLLKRKPRLLYFGIWALVVVFCGAVSLLSIRGEYQAERLVLKIVDRSAGCRAVVSDGMLDDLFFFLLPEGRRIISYARDFDPAYGRELAAWLKEGGVDGNSDLIFAAELGPRALVEEWKSIDPDGLRKTVLTPDAYFPTVETWREAVKDIKSVRRREPLGAYLRHLLGANGNRLACQLLEKGDSDAAWQIFWEIANEVDVGNYATLINLSGMVERGFACSKKDLEQLKFLRKKVEQSLFSPTHRRHAALAGGQLYVDPKIRAQQEAARQKALAEDKISPQARAFIETVSAAPKDIESARLARDAIRKGIYQGLVRPDRIGNQLLTLDRLLGDWESAERDSIFILRLSRRHMMANATMGELAGMRGDYLRSERYLRRALETEEELGRGEAQNDLAFTLIQLGKAAEAEPLARQAVKKDPADWNFRETLALALIRGGKPDEGERELKAAEEVVEKSGRHAIGIVRFSIDRAWLMKVRGEEDKLKIAARTLEGLKDLTAAQRIEVAELRK